jgi:hypothetical protein
LTPALKNYPAVGAGMKGRHPAVARSRRAVSIKQKPNYVVEDLRNPPKSQVLGYRTKKLPGGHLVRVAILKRKGPRGGRTVATSIWHPKSERSSSNPAVTRALKSARRKRS